VPDMLKLLQGIVQCCKTQEHAVKSTTDKALQEEVACLT